MTQIRRFILLSIALLCVVLSVRAQTSTPSPSIVLDAPDTIGAGEAWSLYVNLMSGEAGMLIPIVLLNGLSQTTQTVITGTGGIARWDIPAGMTTQSGRSLIIARYGNFEIRRTIRVHAGQAAQTDLLTTTNSMTAYGDSRAMLIGLIRDAYGNPIDVRGRDSEALLDIRFPDGDKRAFSLTPEIGLVWAWVDSLGGPGRVRVQFSLDQATAGIEIQQVPGTARTVTLTLSPPCILNDGRDLLRLTTDIVDGHGNHVVDGTLVGFTLGTGEGYASTADGRAVLTIVPPTMIGLYRMVAWSSDAVSVPVWLQVTDETCS